MASFIARAAEYAFGDPGGVASSDNAFNDVAQDNVHREAINGLSQLLEIVQGTSESTYNPSGLTSREQMATFITRELDAILSVDSALEVPVEQR